MNFQNAISIWMKQTFGPTIQQYNPDDPFHSKTRAFRFLEEAIELGQAEGLTKEDFVRIALYVFNRPVGDINQEIGGVMVTLAAYCHSKNINMVTEGWREFYRIDTDEMRKKIRNKQETKPNGLPAPKYKCDECKSKDDCACIPF